MEAENEKQKAIRLAFLKYISEDKYNFIDARDIDENGTISAQLYFSLIPKIQKKFNLIGGVWFMYQLSELKGIETNNGWIRIESEADLPKEKGLYFLVTRKTGRITIQHRQPLFNKSTLERFSHYQPIQKPNPPIY